MTAPAPSAPPRARRRLWFLLGAIGSALVVTLVVLLIVWRGGAGLPGDTAAGARPQPSKTPAPVALAAAPAPAATPAGPHPSTCGELYSPAMAAAFGTAVLNPAWTEAADSEVRHGTADAELSTVIDAADKLTCVWGNPKGGSDSGLTTNLVWVTAEQSAAVKARLAAAGMTCYEELGGLRCVTETSGDAGTSGESHFVRDGIWLATHYVNSGPDGYTHDIIANVWAGA
ncbi:hypothetical protein [Cryobacterium sp. HLT2-28]|uniref:hypothetical protein n=1 Tax=Cryobacterium sp. HLT2-28 TaxID=1259146 RepID=UPI00106CB764|nr:hypothetical protein [Cryobacterium sp. HLT2-28]TFB96979.1 hypothetical protein E3O48_04735 [Cryobacterium sp. HLT2-28]